MATTSNYGWTTPDDTALVKDGASAIRSLGTAIDTSLNTALGTKKAGLVLLNTTSFSAVASQSINDVFSTTYDYYLVLIDATFSGAARIDMRYRVSGADNSTSNYNTQTAEFDGTANAAARTSSGSTQILHYRAGAANGDKINGTINIFNPFATSKTLLTASFALIQTNSPFLELTSGNFGATTSFTGFSIIPTTGTITGSIQTFGVNK